MSQLSMAYIMMRMRLKSMFSVCLPNDLHPDEFEAVSKAFLY